MTVRRRLGRPSCPRQEATRCSRGSRQGYWVADTPTSTHPPNTRSTTLARPTLLRWIRTSTPGSGYRSASSSSQPTGPRMFRWCVTWPGSPATPPPPLMLLCHAKTHWSRARCDCAGSSQPAGGPISELEAVGWQSCDIRGPHGQQEPRVLKSLDRKCAVTPLFLSITHGVSTGGSSDVSPHQAPNRRTGPRGDGSVG